MGVPPSRLLFADRANKTTHISRHAAADLFLDSLVYGAHSTATDALRGGLPVLTIAGDSFPNRVAASLYASFPAIEDTPVDTRVSYAVRNASNVSANANDNHHHHSNSHNSDPHPHADTSSVDNVATRTLVRASLRDFEDAAVRLTTTQRGYPSIQ